MEIGDDKLREDWINVALNHRKVDFLIEHKGLNRDDLTVNWDGHVYTINGYRHNSYDTISHKEYLNIIAVLLHSKLI